MSRPNNNNNNNNNNDRRGGGGGGGGRDDRRNDDRRRNDRDESRSRRDHNNAGGGGRMGNSGHENRGSGGMHHGGMGGGGNQRGAGSFNGMAFSDTELMNDLPKKKFTGRCRLFVGNLPNEVKEAELKELFSPHGDIAECYLSGKGFAFLRLDTRAHAESAKEAIDGRVLHGRQVRVRFAVHGAALRVKELSPTVSNEMLYHAFSHFGEVERAVHIVDEKGRPTGEGIVEFERKPSCNEAIQAIREKVFLLTASPKPLIVEPLEPKDEDDGLAERMIPRTPQLNKERELGPRFPSPNSFEYIYGLKWKELYDMEKQRRTQLDDELRDARRRLEQDMELAYQDYQAQMLREDLQRRQQELERLEAARRERMGMRQGPPPGIGGGPGGPPMGGGGHGMGPGNMGPGGMGGGPPGPNYGQQSFGQPPIGNPYSGNPHQNQPQSFNGPPPQQQQMAPQQGGGGPGGQAPPGQRAGPNMLEGVQRLLQIFKNEPNALGGSPQRDMKPMPQGIPNNSWKPQGGGPPQMYGNPMGGSPFGGPQDFPPEKRMRR